MSKSRLRLEGKVALISGGAGEIGQAICDSYLREGAIVVLSGRTRETLEEAVRRKVAEHPEYKSSLFFQVIDHSNPESLSDGLKRIARRLGGIDILVNNAGTAGPKQELANLPTEMGRYVSETVPSAVESLLLGPWLTTQTFLPILRYGASVINLSTIFSRTPYYGRAAYVVPKAGLNALTKGLAAELGDDPRKIRLNTVYPGPVETTRIRKVFAAMDKMKDAEDGTTKAEILSLMLMKESVGREELIPREDVAQTAVFLGSDESQSFTGHDFEVTRGIRVQKDSCAQLTSKPKVDHISMHGDLIWIVAGNQVREVLELIERFQQQGAEILVTFQDFSSYERARSRIAPSSNVQLHHWNLDDTKQWLSLEASLQNKNHPSWTVIVLPRLEQYEFSSLLQTDPNAIENFVHDEITASIVLAKHLETIFKFHDLNFLSSPKVFFLGGTSNSSDSLFARIRRSSIQQLIRTWRHENEVNIARASRIRGARVSQIVRNENSDPGCLNLCVDWIIFLSENSSQFGAIDLVIDSKLKWSRVSSGPEAQVDIEWTIQLNDRVALITGGSEGIGGAISRQLAISGARIAIAERNEEKLAKCRARLILEMEGLNLPNPEGRILTIGNADVAKEETLHGLIRRVVAKFGRIDFLINNAGLVGAEEMAVDISLSEWRKTLSGNLISNYQLLVQALPHMVSQQFGHVINISSYFGTTRHGAVPYTNRSDYAVSKAGQIALVEAITSTLGPSLQINAIAPGPVDGARLNGTEGRPGLYARRARLILENKRLNEVYSAVVQSLDSGFSLLSILEILIINKISDLLESQVILPGPIQKLIHNPETAQGGIREYCFLTKRLFVKLTERLKNGGRVATDTPVEGYINRFQEVQAPLFEEGLVTENAINLRKKMVQKIALGRMPTDLELSREVARSLIHRTITGEVIFPSCGFRFEGFKLGDCFGFADGKTVTNIEVTRAPNIENHGKNGPVFLLGNSMCKEMAEVGVRLGAHFRVVIFTLSDSFPEKLNQILKETQDAPEIQVIQTIAGLETTTINHAIEKFGNPQAILSFPTAALPTPNRISDQPYQNLPTFEEFKQMINTQILNHIMISKRAALIDDCAVLLVTATEESQTDSWQRSWIRFIRDTLRPFTLAAGTEAGFLPHGARFFQIGTKASDSIFYNTIAQMIMGEADQSPVKIKKSA